MTSDHSHHHQTEQKNGMIVRDPVCGMRVDPQTTTNHLSHDDHDYYFCSIGCEAKFTTAPSIF